MSVPIRGYEITGLTVHIGSGTDASMQIDFCDEGGGFFIHLRTQDGPVSLNPDELTGLGKWAQQICVSLDRQNKGEQAPVTL